MLADSEVEVSASVPELVIGDPERVSHAGTVIPTEVTVPEPLSV
jgi:hypothetical protein